MFEYTIEDDLEELSEKCFRIERTLEPFKYCSESLSEAQAIRQRLYMVRVELINIKHEIHNLGHYDD